MAKQLKGAVEDRKLLRRHCKRLEGELAALKQSCAAAEARASGKEEDARALESGREALECEVRLLESRLAAAAGETEKARAATVAAEEAAAAREAALGASHKETLRSAQVVIAALKEEVGKLRATAAEAEAEAAAERSRATAATSARDLGESAAEARLRAELRDVEARHAEALRLREARIAALQEASDAAVEAAARSARAAAVGAERTELGRRFEQREADLTAWHAVLFVDAQAAAAAAFEADRLVRANDEPPAAAAEPSPTGDEPERRPRPRRFSPPASQRHKWRTITVRATFGAGPLGLNVSADRAVGLRVTRVRGQALAAGAAAGDRVKAINGVPLPPEATEIDFADAVAASERPVDVDLLRDVPAVDVAPPERDDDGWVLDTMDRPCPSFGIYSPVVTHLLQQWTADPNKLKYVQVWLGVAADSDHKSRTAPSTFPRGLQLPGLRTELKDGFLAIVVPILRRSRGHANVKCKTRQIAESDDKWDLALRVEIPEPPATPQRQPSTSSLPRSAPASLFRSSGATSSPAAKDDDDQAERDKLAAQRRKAVEEKLAKMRDSRR